MKLAHQAIGFLPLAILSMGTASAQLVPPQQDYYLHVYQKVDFCCGKIDDAMGGSDFWASHSSHELAWAETAGNQIVSDALTVESWVQWEGSDFEEAQAATGVDMDRMTLFCGQKSYGFQRNSNGWTFFLQTGSGAFPDTGTIPLPLGEWAHLAATYDGAMIRTFLDGVEQTTTAASGTIPALGDAFPEQCSYATHEAQPGPPSHIFGIGLGKGVTAGMRQLRIWNRAVPEAEILANASLQLDGTESGLVGYWPLDGPPDPAQAPNMVAGGAPLTLGFNVDIWGPHNRATWRLTDPMFVVREDLAEDALVTDCPWLKVAAWSLLDVQDDLDQDLVFAGGYDDFCLTTPAPFFALIRDGANGFVFDTASAISGMPMADVSFRTVTADFNGDGRMDVFSGNFGGDFCNTVGAPNTLLLSRPDGRLEDGSGNLLGVPCNADTPQFAGQHMCYAGGDQFGRTPGVRYPGTGEAVAPDPDATHSVAEGDIDGDGDVDILVGNVPWGSIEMPYLLLNDGQGKFLANWQMLPDYLYGLPFQRGSAGYLLEDIDSDGHVDLVDLTIQLDASDEIVSGISWNDGSGDFSTAERLVITATEGVPGNAPGVPASSTPAMATDIDNDGDKDLLVFWDPEGGVNDPPFDVPASLQIMINQGGRVFTDETVARVGVPPQAGMPRNWIWEFHVGDVNLDGCPDLVFLDDDSRLLDTAIWLNDCEGNFSPVAGPGLPKKGGWYVPLDYDDDGDLDFISAIGGALRIAGTEGCLVDPQGATGDYIDFAVLLNTIDLLDTDGDGVADIHDSFDNDPDEWFDADSDGIGDNADLDDDNDQIPDSWETANGLNLRDASDAYLDGDGDSYININEFLAGTDPRKANSSAAIFLDLVSLGNVNGNNKTDLGVLLRDLDSDKNKLYAMDGGSGNNFRTVSFGTEQYQASTNVADGSGDQVPEYGVLVSGSLFSRVKDVVNNTLLGRPRFNANYEPIAFLSVGEAGGAAGPDVAMVGREEATGRVQAWVKEVAGGALVSRMSFSKTFVPFAAVAVDNVGDTNAMEIAVLGIDATGKVQATVKDAQSGTLIAKFKFNKLFTRLYFAAVPDANGNLTNLAVLGRNASGVIQAQIKRVSDGALVNSIKFSKGYDPRAFFSFADSNGSGSGELGVVGVNASGAVRAQVKEIADGTAVKNINFGKSYPPLDAIAINGAAGTGQNEIAVLGRHANGQYRLQIMDLLTGNLVNKIPVP